jgi:hypothetical protein
MVLGVLVACLLRFDAPRVTPRVVTAPVAIPLAPTAVPTLQAPPTIRRHPEAFAGLTLHATDLADRRDDLLAIVAFCGSDNVAVEYTVARTGKEWDVRVVYDWADQNERSKQLSETDLVRLRVATAGLPLDGNVAPPIDRLVIVGFHRGAEWVHVTYDSAKLPEAMREIYDIVGERAETRKRAPNR